MNISRSSRSGAAFTLIELLVVIAIIAILAGLAFTSMTSAMLAAKRVVAKSDMSQIAGAVQAYYTEYGRYPIASTVTTDAAAIYGGANSNDLIISVLRYKPLGSTTQTTLDSLNPRQIKFIEPKVTTSTKGCVNSTTGKWYDPWGTQYIIFIDADYGGDISAVTAFSDITTNPSVSVGVASVGYYYVKSNTNPQPDSIAGVLNYGSNKNTILLSWQ